VADASSRPFELPAPGSAGDLLLERTTDYFEQTDDTRASLRMIAEEVGTSHRMLQYHFASRERLLGSVMLRLRDRQIAAGDDYRMTASTRAEYLAKSWESYLHPGNRVYLDLMISLTNPMSDAVEDESLMRVLRQSWNSSLVELGIAEGLTPLRAEREARVLRAALRGLHHDLHVSRDVEGVNAALLVLIEWVTPER
jgi:AcrR family transcriptional regulator